MAKLLNSNWSIKSDGTAAGTLVTDETGNPVGLVQKIVWEVSVDDPWAKAEITVAGVPLEAVAKMKKQYFGGLTISSNPSEHEKKTVETKKTSSIDITDENVIINTDGTITLKVDEVKPEE